MLEVSADRSGVLENIAMGAEDDSDQTDTVDFETY